MPGGLSPAPPPEGEEIELGKVAGVFGVQGELRLHLHHRDSQLLARARPVVLVDGGGARWAARMSTREGAGRRVIGRLDASMTRDDAEAMIGWRVRVPASDLPPLDPDEFWVWQVVGGEVWIGGESVGKVVEVHSTGPVDVFEVQIRGRKEPMFVPSLAEFVAEVGPGRLVLHEGALAEDP